MKIKTTLYLALFILLSGNLSAQNQSKKIIITGIVTDSQNNPVKGAAIFIDKERSASTNKKGIYKVKVNPKAVEILAILSPKGAAKDVINGRTNINLSLTVSELTLQGAFIASLEKEEAQTKVHRFSSYSNIFDMIKGELSNVVVRGTSVYAQGISTFGGNSEVLFVVDGIITEHVNEVAPVDVDTIRLLKGPETAAYGMQGANGVIIITTIRGTNTTKH